MWKKSIVLIVGCASYYAWGVAVGDQENAVLSKSVVIGLREFRDNELEGMPEAIKEIERGDDVGLLLGDQPVTWPADWPILRAHGKGVMLAIPTEHFEMAVLPSGEADEETGDCFAYPAFRYRWGAVFVGTTPRRRKHQIRKAIDLLCERFKIPDATAQAAQSLAAVKSDLELFHEEMIWARKTVDWEKLPLDKAIYIAALANLHTETRDVTKCREFESGERTIICYSADTLDKSILLTFEVFEKGEALYDVDVSLSAIEERRRQFPEGSEAMRGIAASVLHYGLSRK